MSERRHVLLASERDWLGRSLMAVLEPSGFRLEQVATGAEAVRRAEELSPDIIMLDESLPDAPVADLCRRLSPTIETGRPILLYSSGDWGSSDLETAFEAGAWDHIEEPIRPGQLLRKLERLSGLKELIAESRLVRDASGPAAESIGGLVRLMSMFGSIAERSDAEVGCAVIGPTRPGSGPGEAESLRRETLALVGRQIRGSDACAWIGPAELAVLLYGAGIEGLGAFVGRLARAQHETAERTPDRSISAGLVSFASKPSKRPTPGPRAVQALAPLEAARDALLRARDAGGGIRVAVQV